MSNWLAQLDRLFIRKRETHRHCCSLLCWRTAEWQVWNVGPNSGPYDFTEACTKHVGRLFGDGTKFKVIWIDDDQLKPSSICIV